MGYIYYDEDTPATGNTYAAVVSPNEKWTAILKIISLFGFAVVLGGIMLVRQFTSPGTVATTSVKSSFGKIEYSTPYKNVLYENFGFVSEPKLTLPLRTLNGYVDTTFLLDSGAVVSALPLKAAHDTGVDLVQAKRITLQGFSGKPTFAYLDSVVVQIAKKDFSFPAVFTESNQTTYILGRKGLFDEFTIQFDSNTKAVTMTTRE